MMRNYLSLIKFSHTIFAMPFAFIGFFLASYKSEIDWKIFISIILCMVFARSSAMA
ncbi:MAG: 4-hydroxybenzoate octaprenyltransferase, partial [Flavobacteriales bacterium]|nr:4-hydroxybenzoate octaprenyltransferase [Flavobacteriales bacterium]